MEPEARLFEQLGAVLAPSPREPSPERVAALRAAADAASAPAGVHHAADELAARRGLRPRALALAAAAAVAAAVVALVVLPRTASPPGTLEYVAVVESPEDLAASAEVRLTDIGRIVLLETADLPILPTGEYYELWFVAADDRSGDPNRISAGTFHPDPQGRSEVALTAAVNPELFPTLSVTAEPGDGDPAPTGDEVVRFRLIAAQE